MADPFTYHIDRNTILVPKDDLMELMGQPLGTTIRGLTKVSNTILHGRSQAAVGRRYSAQELILDHYEFNFTAQDDEADGTPTRTWRAAYSQSNPITLNHLAFWNEPFLVTCLEVLTK